MDRTLAAAALIVFGWLLGLPTALFTRWLRRRRGQSDCRASRQYETLIAVQESLRVDYRHCFDPAFLGALVELRQGSVKFFKGAIVDEGFRRFIADILRPEVNRRWKAS